MFPEIDLSLTDHTGRIIAAGILFLAGTAMTYRAYYGRRAPSGMPYRHGLFLLRFSSILLISFLLLGPLLQIRRTRMARPVYSLLIDRSLSMDLPVRDDSGDPVPRIEKVRDHFSREGLLKALRSKADVRSFIFSDRVVAVEPDSIFGSRRGLAPGRTDLVAALKAGRESVPESDGILVVTDGRINRGEDLREFRTGEERLLFLGVGEDSGEPDIDVAAIEIPPRLIEGSPIPATITLRVRSERADSVILTVSGEETPLESTVLALESGEYLRDVFLTIPPLPSGRHLLPIAVEAIEGESQRVNNRRVLVLEVEPAVKRALVISTKPCWDLSFLLKALRDLDYLAVDLYMFRPGSNGGVFVSDGDEVTEGTLPDSPDSNPYDLLCVQGDIADPRFSVSADFIRSFSEPGKGIIFLITEGIEGAHRANSAIRDLLPARVPNSFEIVSGRFDVVPPHGGDARSTRTAPDLDRGLFHWSSLPPMTGLLGEATNGRNEPDNDRVLMSAQDGAGGEVPIVVVEDRRGTRIISLLGRGFWRWSFHRSRAADMGSGYRRFIDTLTRWAIGGRDAGDFRLLPTAMSVPQGEPIEFRIEDRIADEELVVVLDPVDRDAPPDTFSYRLHGEQTSPSALVIPPRPPGDYRYSYRLREREIAGQGDIYVDAYSNEYSRPQPDDRLLAEAMLTGVGEYVDLFSVTGENLNKYAPLERIEKFYLTTIVINSQPLIFIVILILLIVELYFRKASGFS